MPERERSQVEIGRLDRAGTLLLASLALAVVVMLGWGGPIFDLRRLGDLAGTVAGSMRDGLPVGPAIVALIRSLQPTDLAPLAGSAVTIVLVWHVLSLVAEVILVVADALGWLRTRWLWPVWRVLDVLD